MIRPSHQLAAYLSGEVDESAISPAVYSWSRFAVYKMACAALDAGSLEGIPGHLHERVRHEARRLHKLRRQQQ